jgi:hypothetical protein
MATVKQRIGMQDNTTKGKVRQFILDQTIAFQNQHRVKLFVGDLPAEKWLFANGLFASLGKKNIKMIYGFENSKKSAIVNAIASNPLCCENKNVKLELCNISDFISDAAKKYFANDEQYKVPSSKITRFNVVWADFCGNPAEHNKHRQKRKFTYKDIDAFVDFVSVQNKPALYYLTFSITGARIVGGKKALKQALSAKAKNMPAAILEKIEKKLSSARVRHKVKRILKVIYRGGSRDSSQMITIGFAINFSPRPTFPIVKENWIGNLNKNKIQKIKKNQEITDLANLQKKAIILLLNSKKLSKHQIANAFQVSVMKVGAIAAHITMGTYK